MKGEFWILQDYGKVFLLNRIAQNEGGSHSPEIVGRDFCYPIQHLKWSRSRIGRVGLSPRDGAASATPTFKRRVANIARVTHENVATLRKRFIILSLALSMPGSRRAYPTRRSPGYRRECMYLLNRRNQCMKFGRKLWGKPRFLFVGSRELLLEELHSLSIDPDQV